MEKNTQEKTVLVLTGEAGELYAIPQEALQQYLATDEQRAAIEEQWGEGGDDVSGYSMYQSFLAGQAHSHKQAEFNQRSEEIRHKADYVQMSAGGGQADAGGGEAAKPKAASNPLRKGFFTGVLTTLRLIPAKVTE